MQALKPAAARASQLMERMSGTEMWGTASRWSVWGGGGCVCGCALVVCVDLCWLCAGWGPVGGGGGGVNH